MQWYVCIISSERQKRAVLDTGFAGSDGGAPRNADCRVVRDFSGSLLKFRHQNQHIIITPPIQNIAMVGDQLPVASAGTSARACHHYKDHLQMRTAVPGYSG